MRTYFSTFISGFEEIVRETLTSIIKDCKIVKLLDGLVVYRTTYAFDEIRKLRFFNNSFLPVELSDSSSMEEVLSGTIENTKLLGNIRREIKSLGKTFRIIFSSENQIVSIDKNKTQRLEKLLSEDLILDKANPDTELWFLKRSEGNIFIGIRITRPENADKHLQKGELRPELAHLLCLLSEPSKGDVLLDPFAGSGAIAKEISKFFPYKKLIIGDNDKQIFRKLQDKYKNRKDMVLGRWDATSLSSLTGGSVDKIVTDPPWGFYQNADEDLEVFYAKMLKEFSRVVKDKGLIVTLVGQKDIFDKVIGDIKLLQLIKQYDILVSGKKARIYKLRKNETV